MNVAKDVRKLVWGCSGMNKTVNEVYKTNVKYFKEFNGYYKMFMEAPRIHFGGYYVMKEKYTKIGEKDINHTFTPLIVV